jgi:hypothetical protein
MLVIGLGLFVGVGGIVAWLAGAAGLNEIDRLRRVGRHTSALVRYRAPRADDRVGSPRPLLQFATDGGGVMEVFSPVPSSRSHALVDGERIAITYDPLDPRQVLVDGRERRWLEYCFLALGAVAVLAALTMLLAG